MAIDFRNQLKDIIHRIKDDRMEKPLKRRKFIHICFGAESAPEFPRKQEIDELCSPFPPPPHPLAHPQTAPIGIGIRYRGGGWVRKRVCGRVESGISF